MVRIRTPDTADSGDDDDTEVSYVRPALMGRPSKRDFPLARESVLINALRMGMSAERACDLVGIDAATFRRWKKKDESLDRKAKLARSQGVATLAQVAWDLALTSSSDAIRLKAAKYLLSVLDPEMIERTRAGIDEGSSESGQSEIDFTYL